MHFRISICKNTTSFSISFTKSISSPHITPSRNTSTKNITCCIISCSSIIFPSIISPSSFLSTTTFKMNTTTTFSNSIVILLLFYGGCSFIIYTIYYTTCNRCCSVIRILCHINLFKILSWTSKHTFKTTTFSAFSFTTIIIQTFSCFKHFLNSKSLYRMNSIHNGLSRIKTINTMF